MLIFPEDSGGSLHTAGAGQAEAQHNTVFDRVNYQCGSAPRFPEENAVEDLNENNHTQFQQLGAKAVRIQLKPS